jgi:hypothetical protein
MYQVRPENILSFIDDHSIRFPRFQRKQTWKSEQNLRLAISVFKTYPIGVTIINKQTWGGRSTRWLLDGRQRRNALLLMSQNPENIYNWAKRFLGLKNSDQLQDINDKFWTKIEEYLNDSDQEGFEATKINAIKNGEKEFYFDGKTYKTEKKQITVDDDLELDFSEEENDYTIESEDQSEDNIDEYNQSIWGNLDELLFIIKTVHTKNNIKSGFTSPFDFRKIIDTLSYSEDGNKFLSGQKLTTFIKEYLNYVFDNNLDDINSKTLLAYFKSRLTIDASKLKPLSASIQKNWNGIESSIKVVQIIKNRLKESIIGIIETENITATDSQMIFMLINQEGTKLSAVEILSAKPAWNIPVKNPSNKLEEHRKPLYQAINTNYDNTVRWDYPATLYERTDQLSFLFPKLDYNKTNQLEKKLTLGFKILSGIYQKGIKKEDVDKLALNKDINWEFDVDRIIDELNLMGKVLSDSPYFKYLISWNQNILNITSDAIALNFLFTTYFDFIRKDKPVGTSSKTKIFINNAIILADKLVYEYVTLKWRGSSDSKISRNINSFTSLPDKYEPLNNTIWLDLIKKINDKQLIEDEDISFSICKTLIYHIYSSHSFMGPDIKKIDIDHIIPQNMFDRNSSIPNAVNIKDSLFNLCPLPSKENISKMKKKLKNIDDPWLTQQIEKYSYIKASDFDKFSDVNNWSDLRTYRRRFFEEEFLQKKLEIIS